MQDNMKILQTTENICLYCGRQKIVKFDEYETYFECDCYDAKKEREIKDQINELKRQLPEKKYEILTKNVLIKK